MGSLSCFAKFTFEPKQITVSVLKLQFRFTSDVWKYDGAGGWFFVSLPKKLSGEIRKNFASEEEGWGRLKVNAKIGDSDWETSIWFDSKKGTYILPLKAAIREKEKIESGEKVKVAVFI